MQINWTNQSVSHDNILATNRKIHKSKFTTKMTNVELLEIQIELDGVWTIACYRPVFVAQLLYLVDRLGIWIQRIMTIGWRIMRR